MRMLRMHSAAVRAIGWNLRSGSKNGYRGHHTERELLDFRSGHVATHPLLLRDVRVA